MTQTFQIINGDIQFSVSGGAKMIVDADKVHQDVREMLAISVTDGFGTGLVDLIGRVDEVDLLRGAIYNAIYSAVDNFIILQRGKQKGQRPSSELVDSVRMLQVAVGDDSTTFDWQLDLATVDQQVQRFNWSM